MKERKIEDYVFEILKDEDKNGHGMAHINRVVNLALSFAKDIENVDIELVELAAYLHEVDDYKIFGDKNADELPNARKILDSLNTEEKTKNEVLNIIQNMGYSKYLKGVRPQSIEGKIVSDADMCDALGINGILRTYSYTKARGGVFFDKDILPEDFNLHEYKNKKNKHSVQHFFDKLLLLPNIMLTEVGKEEAYKRVKIMIDFLKELFREEDSEIWLKYLDEFLSEQNIAY